MEKHFYVVFKPGFNSEILELPTAFLIKEGVERVRLRTGSRGRGGKSDDDDNDCISWSVEIYRYMKHVYLNRGWDKFVEKHYLEENDFLFFKYDGGNCFSVTVFHQSGKEKVFDSHDTVKQEEDEDIDDDEGETSIYKNRSKKQKIHHSPPGESRRDRTMKDCNIIEEKMKDFSSPNPFMGRLMKGYNVNIRYILNLPRSLVIKMMDEEAKEVTLNLKNREGTTWEAVLKESNGQYFILPSGWRRFVVDNSLKVGDVCVFERVSGGQHSVIVWQVHVF